MPGGSTGRAEPEFLQLQHFRVPSCPAWELECVPSVCCENIGIIYCWELSHLEDSQHLLWDRAAFHGAMGRDLCSRVPGAALAWVVWGEGTVLGPAVIWGVDGYISFLQLFIQFFLQVSYFIFKGDSCLRWALAVWMQALCSWFLWSAAGLVLVSLLRCHFIVTALSRNGHFLFEMTF